jgi:hypothetical protein
MTTNPAIIEAAARALRFRKKPVEVDAVKWDGENVDKITAFLAGHGRFRPLSGVIEITTLEGVMTARKGDWIIKGTKGEFYPCKPDIFADIYEPVE